MCCCRVGVGAAAVAGAAADARADMGGGGGCCDGAAVGRRLLRARDDDDADDADRRRCMECNRNGFSKFELRPGPESKKGQRKRKGESVENFNTIPFCFSFSASLNPENPPRRWTTDEVALALALVEACLTPPLPGARRSSR